VDDEASVYLHVADEAVQRELASRELPEVGVGSGCMCGPAVNHGASVYPIELWRGHLDRTKATLSPSLCGDCRSQKAPLTC